MIESSRSIPKATWALAVLLCANIVAYVDRMIIGLVVEPIRLQFHLSDTQVGLLVGLAFALVYAVAGLPLGWWVDRGSRRGLIAVGSLVWGIGAVSIGFARTFWMLVVARMGVGVGEGTLAPAATSLIGDYFARKHLARALSVYALGGLLGSGFALLAGGALIQGVNSLPPINIPLYGPLATWQATLILSGLPSFAIIALMFTVSEPPRRVRQEDVQLTRSLVHFGRYFWQRRGFYVGHFLTFSVLAIFAFALTTWNPTFLMRVHGVKPAQAGYLLGLIWVGCGSAGNICGGILADKLFGRGMCDAAARVTMWACILIGPLAGAFPLVHSLELSLVLLGMLIFVVGIPTGLAATMINLATPSNMRGQIMAAYLFCVYLIGYGIGPTLVGAISDHLAGGAYGLRHSLSIVGFIAGPLGLCAIWSAQRPFRRLEAIEAAQDPATVTSSIPIPSP